MTLLFRLLQRVPSVQRLQKERDSLHGDLGSMRLKLRAASAEMDVLEDQCRVLRRERDQLAEAAVRQATDHASQIKAALLANAALLKERDLLAEENRALVAQEASPDGRGPDVRSLDGLRRTGPMEAAG